MLLLCNRQLKYLPCEYSVGKCIKLCFFVPLNYLTFFPSLLPGLAFSSFKMGVIDPNYVSIYLLYLKYVLNYAIGASLVLIFVLMVFLGSSLKMLIRSNYKNFQVFFKRKECICHLFPCADGMRALSPPPSPLPPPPLSFSWVPMMKTRVCVSCEEQA